MAQRKTTATKQTATKAASTTCKKANAPKWKGDQDLFIVINGKEVTSQEQFKSQLSPIYNVEEFYWTGKIDPTATIKFVRSNGQDLPIRNEANHGFSLIGQAMTKFEVRNGLQIPSETNDCNNVYVNPNTELIYVGDNKKHTIYVRIYDNASGNYNDRWLTISIE